MIKHLLLRGISTIEYLMMNLNKHFQRLIQNKNKQHLQSFDSASLFSIQRLKKNHKHSKKDVHFLEYPIYLGGNGGRGSHFLPNQLVLGRIY